MLGARGLVGYRNVSSNLIRVVKDRPEKAEEHESNYNHEPGESEAILAEDQQYCLLQRGIPQATIVPDGVGWCEAHGSRPAWRLGADHWYRTLGSATP